MEIDILWKIVSSVVIILLLIQIIVSRVAIDRYYNNSMIGILGTTDSFKLIFFSHV